MKKIILSTFVASSFLFAADYTNSIGMVFKEIPAGSFMMGTPAPNCPKDNPFTSDKNENEYNHCLTAEIPHKVTLKGFYMAESEVTQKQWYEVMGDNPAWFKTGNPDMPVESITWYDAKEFIKKLNAIEKTDKYRLPTEEEWEYAARAGTTTKWYCGDNESCLNSIAYYSISGGPIPVKSKKPNAWGLYDMSGNVYEWTSSCLKDDFSMIKDCDDRVIRGGSWANLFKVFNDSNIVIRGGSWSGYPKSTRSAYKESRTPDDSSFDRGFRLLRMK